MDYDHCFLQKRDDDKDDSEPQQVVVCDFRECSRRRVTFSLIVFFFSYSTIGSLAYYSLLKDELGMDPAELNAYYTFINFLFLLKPLYGFVTDSCYIFGRRRKPYIIICGILASLLWVGMGYFAHNGIAATLLMFLINGMLGLINSVSQALVVEDSQEKQKEKEESMEVTYNDAKANKNVSLFFMLDAVGLLLSSYLSGFLVSQFPLHIVFLIASAVPLLISLAGMILNEKCVTSPAKPAEVKEITIVQNQQENDQQMRKTCKQQLKKIFHFLKIKAIILPIIFIFLFTLTPSTYDAMFYFYMNELHFDYEFIGRIQLVSSAAMMVGIVIYYRWLSKHSFKRLITISTIVATIFNLVQLFQILRINIALGIPDTYLALSLDLVTNSLAQLQLMPVLVLACKLCPKHLEAAIYESILGIKNIAYFMSYRIGGFLIYLLGITSTNFKNLWILSLISTMFPVITLGLLCFVPIKTDYKEEFELLEKNMRERDDERDHLVNTD